MHLGERFFHILEYVNKITLNVKNQIFVQYIKNDVD